MRIAVLACGVSRYPAASLEPGEHPLAFAGKTAIEASSRLTRLWPGAEPHIQLLLDDEVTAAGLERVFGDLAAAGPLDALVFYFAGHGRADGLVLSGTDGTALLTPAALAASLKTVEARTRYLFLDVCHAGGIGADLARLDVPDSHIFAATGERQQAWEDTEYQRTCFGEALFTVLDGLPEGAGPLALIDRFADIRSKTTLAAYAQKQGARQEPEYWHAASRPGGQVSVFRALRRRFWQLTSTAALLAAVTVAVAMGWLYHFDVSASGLIVAKYGPRSLSFLNVGALDTRLETPYAVNQIVADEDKARLADGRIGGVWTRRDKDGVEDWLAKLKPLMLPETANFIQVDLGQVPWRSDQRYSLPVMTNAIALWGSQGVDEAAVQAMYQAIWRSDGWPCNRDIALLSLSSPEGQAKLQRLLMLSAQAAESSTWFDGRFLESLIRTMQKQNASFAPDDKGTAMMWIAEAIMKRRLMAGQPAASEDVRAMLKRMEAEPGACPALARIFEARFDFGDTAALADDFADRLKKRRAYWDQMQLHDPGSAAEMQATRNSIEGALQEAADGPSPWYGIWGLIRSGRFADLPAGSAAVRLISDYFDDTDSLHSMLTENSLLMLVSSGALPTGLIDHLLHLADEKMLYQQDASLLGTGTVLDVLSRQMPYMTAEQGARFVGLLTQLEEQLGHVSQIAPVEHQRLNRLYLESYWSRAAMTVDIPDTVRRGILAAGESYDTWRLEPVTDILAAQLRPPVGLKATNMARLGLVSTLPDAARALLEKYIQDVRMRRLSIPQSYTDSFMGFQAKFDDAGMQVLNYALALGRHRYHDITTDKLVESIYRRIAVDQSAESRDLEGLVASEWLAAQPPAVQSRLLQDLRGRWQAEKTTIVRLYLASIIRTVATSALTYDSVSCKRVLR